MMMVRVPMLVSMGMMVEGMLVVMVVMVMIMTVLVVTVVMRAIIMHTILVCLSCMGMGAAGHAVMRDIGIGCLAFDLHLPVAATANRAHQLTSSSLILSSSPAVTWS